MVALTAIGVRERPGHHIVAAGRLDVGSRQPYGPKIAAKGRASLLLAPWRGTCHGRTYAEGKKLSWRDGVADPIDILRYHFFD